MRRVDGTLVLSATDLTNFLACEHLTELDREALRLGEPRPRRDDPELQLIRDRGAGHEKAYLGWLEARGCAVAKIEPESEGLEGLRDFERRTLAAMLAGYDYIYQGGFFDGRWYGRPDFLRRVGTPSDLGAWSYEVEDTKLARRLKVAALIQMAEYSRQLARVQGRAPESVHVVLGNRKVDSRPLADVAAYCDAARQRFEAALAVDRTTYPDPVDHCRVCDWAERCVERRRHDDHLSLVAGLHRRQIAKLQAAGVTTVLELAARHEPVEQLSDVTLERVRTQASLQVAHRQSGSLSYEFAHPQSANQGLALLPEPCDGDLFFDIEGDGFVGEHGLEYLFGVLELDCGVERYTPFWGHDAAAEQRAFEAFMDFVMDRLRRRPNLHVYHYSTYEPAALKRLAGRYATREDDLDRLLRGKVLVDLYAVVRGALIASTESYSLKALEPFYMSERTERIRDASSSIVEYERWLTLGDDAILGDIAAYNETDCHSTRLLRDWLEALRAEYATTFGVAVVRPALRDPEPSEDNAVVTADTEALAGALLESVPDSADLGEEQRACRLLAGVLDWHRREARPEWWEYFARLEMTSEQLVDDAYAVAGLTALVEPTVGGGAVVQRYSFDPAQDTRIDVGAEWIDPANGAVAGRVVWIDRAAGLLDLRRGAAARSRGHPLALVPPGPRASVDMRKALHRLGEWVVTHGVDAPGAYRAARDLLLGRRPRVAGVRVGDPLRSPGEAAVDAAVRVATALEASTLPIQGPPGSGKTYAAACIALALVQRGRRVGVSALSHRAISHLVGEICRQAKDQGRIVRIVQKADPSEACASPMVRCTSSAGDVVGAVAEDAVDVVAGTAWLFSREDISDSLDTLIVDEASQVSLANVLAMSGAARNLVLCGDPQQLSQPTRGVHPGGAEVSSLQHVLGGAHTIAPDKGLFLDVTRRLHPDLCNVISDVFYDGRLSADSACAQRTIEAPLPSLRPAGLHVLPVLHSDNGVRSTEEAAAVDVLVQALLAGSVSEGTRAPRSLRPTDLIVLAPYNAQVSTIAGVLPEHVRVGTVDKFQGQEAAVAIYSMATSSGEDQRRGMDFLYSLNRLDVALSRAQAVAILVCSPALTQVRCRTVDQLLLANALCRLVAAATPLRLPSVQRVLDLEVAGALHPS